MIPEILDKTKNSLLTFRIFLNKRHNFFSIVNGQRYWQSVWDYSRDRVSNWMDVIRSASGREFQQQDKHHYTDNPTIQGMWHSYVNTEPHVALAKFPDVSEQNRIPVESIILKSFI